MWRTGRGCTPCGHSPEPRALQRDSDLEARPQKVSIFNPGALEPPSEKSTRPHPEIVRLLASERGPLRPDRERAPSPTRLHGLGSVRRLAERLPGPSQDRTSQSVDLPSPQSSSSAASFLFLPVASCHHGEISLNLPRPTVWMHTGAPGLAFFVAQCCCPLRRCRLLCCTCCSALSQGQLSNRLLPGKAGAKRVARGRTICTTKKVPLPWSKDTPMEPRSSSSSNVLPNNH